MGNICSACERDKEYFQIKETSTKQPRTIAVTTLIEKERRHYTETIERRTSSKRLDILAESFKEEKQLPVNTSMTQQEFLKRTLKNMKKLNASLRPSTSYLIKGEVAMRALTGEQSYSQDSCYYEVDTYSPEDFEDDPDGLTLDADKIISMGLGWQQEENQIFITNRTIRVFRPSEVEGKVSTSSQGQLALIKCEETTSPRAYFLKRKFEPIGSGRGGEIELQRKKLNLNYDLFIFGNSECKQINSSRSSKMHFMNGDNRDQLSLKFRVETKQNQVVMDVGIFDRAQNEEYYFVNQFKIIKCNELTEVEKTNEQFVFMNKSKFRVSLQYNTLTLTNLVSSSSTTIEILKQQENYSNLVMFIRLFSQQDKIILLP